MTLSITTILKIWGTLIMTLIITITREFQYDFEYNYQTQNMGNVDYDYNDYMRGPNTKFGDSLDFHISSCIDPM